MTATAQNPCTCSTVYAFDADGQIFTTGCVKTTARRFAPGHDARLKGFLIKHGAAGHTVRRQVGGTTVATTIDAIADGYGFGHQVRAGIKRAADKAFAKLIRDTKRQAKATHETPKQVTCKVGRWTYEGVVTDSPVEGPQFTFTNRKGIQVTTTKFTRI